MTRKGKCTNLGGCLLAYKKEEIEVAEGEFVCPECKSPLAEAGASTKSGGKLFLVAGGVIAVVLLAALVAGVSIQFSRLKGKLPKPTPTPVGTPGIMPHMETPTPVAASPVPFGSAAAGATPEMQVRRALPVDKSGEGESGGAPVALATVDLDPTHGENKDVKAEVLKRIDLMHTSEDNKDKLYMSVERARKMGKLMKIPFASGRTTLAASDIEGLKKELAKPQVQQLLQDPTAVFVILGFADTKGDPAKNLKISEDRATSVLSTLRDKCGVANVLHSVGMGGSTLFDSEGADRNRVAEIWVVLP